MSNLNEDTCLHVTMQDIQWDSRFFVEVNTHPPRNMEEFLVRVTKFMHVDEIVKPSRTQLGKARNSGAH